MLTLCNKSLQLSSHKLSSHARPSKTKAGRSRSNENGTCQVTVTIFKRKTPSGFDNFIVADGPTGKRRFVSFKLKSEGLAEADRVLRKKANLHDKVRDIHNERGDGLFQRR